MTAGRVELIISAREEGFKKSKQPHDYADCRTFISEKYEGYDLILPRFLTQTAVDWILKRVNNPGNGKKARIIDLGCGPEGNAIRQLSTLFPTAICIGVNSRLIKPERSNRLNLFEYDIQKINLLLPSESIDIAMSVKVFNYIPDPFLTIIAINNILKTKGIALITDVPITPVLSKYVDGDKFIEALRQTGFEVETRETAYRFGIHTECDLSWRKIPELKLPVIYNGEFRDQNIQLQNNATYNYTSVVYKYIG